MSFGCMWRNFEIHVTALNFGYKNVKSFLLQASVFPEGHIQNFQHFVTEFKKIKKKFLIINLLLSKSESVKFLLIESVICLFTDSPLKQYISLIN